MIPNPLTSGRWHEVIWRRLTPTLPVLASSPGAPTLASAGLFDARMFQLSNDMQAVLIPDHRYGIPAIGWMQEIRSWTLEDALASYRRWYLPSNAILVFGDVALDCLQALAERHYGVLPPAPTVVRKRPNQSALRSLGEHCRPHADPASGWEPGRVGFTNGGR